MPDQASPPPDPLEATVLKAQARRLAKSASPQAAQNDAAQRLLGAQSIVRRLATAEPLPDGSVQARLDGMDTRATRLDMVTSGILADPVDADILQRRIAELRQATRNEVDFRQALWGLLRVENVPQAAKPILMRRAIQWYQARIATKALDR